jgi:hypothetical protein
MKNPKEKETVASISTALMWPFQKFSKVTQLCLFAVTNLLN